MKVLKIISVIEQYSALKSRLNRDLREYQDYKLKKENYNAQITLNKVMYDYEEIGKFLDEEI